MNNYSASAYISRRAFDANLARMREATTAEVMAVVKADAYGHGRDTISRWAQEKGTSWFGAAQLGEALELRQQLGPHARILTWIYTPDADLRAAVQADLDISVGAPWMLDSVLAAAQECGQTARVHINVDTGMTRSGFSRKELCLASSQFARALAEGSCEIVGLWSHLACADSQDDLTTKIQIDAFEDARSWLQEEGIRPQILHLAASGGVLWHPDSHYDMVRIGIALYGLSPNPQRATGKECALTPVMRVESIVMSDQQLRAGTGISYGHTYRSYEGEHVGVVPIGYADGIPRVASNLCSVDIGGVLCPIRGRVCMDQIVVSGEHIRSGDRVVIFGEPPYVSVDDWAMACKTISYEMLTRVGSRVRRIYQEDTQ
ncbi:alanine racemase [Trueperella sp. LYQ143]|uniref:alanine racemase n=1 Tax=unclassified Trueperella TaxID=2630174 RepID=UPI00398392A4